MFQQKKFSSWLVLLWCWDGLGVQPVLALAVLCLQHEGGLCTEQPIAATLDLPHLTSPLELTQCFFVLIKPSSSNGTARNELWKVNLFGCVFDKLQRAFAQQVFAVPVGW